MQPVILHSDMNNFYASVECLDNPFLRGKPVAVTGDPEARHGIILAKNYEAKKYGIVTGKPLWMARQKCPEIIFTPPQTIHQSKKHPPQQCGGCTHPPVAMAEVLV